ncbi:hypothetical protein B9T25_07300 [Acinetobacter sp. ANC 4470]|uniref:OmpA family protein n=1 Tax=Acinetobacter sp. ANC 4470 TaxID=1977881 RepID=UPI000A32E479|nr:OmpA family protein [Acinetobacter sp. ANC 4470]OTG67787.1 hypothetical protein B9T25_07300 [Acinetobacter sp. ANC 4470]
MIKLQIIRKKLKVLTFCSLVFASSLVLAEPIVVEGIVPNEASKQAILTRMYSIYGANQVIDKIKVKLVSAPNGWSDSVTRIITPDLKKVKQGRLSIRGIQVELTGKMSNQNDIQPTTANFQNMIQEPYRLNIQLSVNQAEQKIIDDALKNRIIEFESGSSILVVSGTKILDEMAVALNKVAGKKVKIIGHTDSSGNQAQNLILSQERAATVKRYLAEKNVPTDNLSVEGLGSTKPVADNTTVEGRKKNRRIEFEVQ